MAFINIKNGIVTRAKKGGKGYIVEEQFKRQDGSDGTQKWNVWFEDVDQLTEGQVVNLGGVYSSKVAEFDGENGTVQFVERSVNKASLSDNQPDQPEGGNEEDLPF